MEDWKELEGYKYKYFLSNFGNAKVIKDNGVIMLKPTIRSGCYQYTIAKEGGGKYSPLINKLVAENFIDNPNEYKYVRNINGDKSDNRSDNIEWVEKRVSLGTKEQKMSLKGYEGYIHKVRKDDDKKGVQYEARYRTVDGGFYKKKSKDKSSLEKWLEEIKEKYPN